jgi:hypothetical protein
MSGHVLDLTRTHFTRQLGDVTVIGSWIGESLDESEPCLVLLPTYQRHSYERVKPCCIALSSAYLYDDPRYLLARSMEFNKALGFTDDMSHVHKVADVIYDHLQDLIEMPPRPVTQAYEAADAIITDANGRRKSAVIMDYN